MFICLCTTQPSTSHQFQVLACLLPLYKTIENIQSSLHYKKKKLYKSAFRKCTDGENVIASQVFNIASAWVRRWYWGCCLAPVLCLAPSGCWARAPPPASSRSWRDLAPCAWCAPRFCGGASCRTALCRAWPPFSPTSELTTLRGSKQVQCITETRIGGKINTWLWKKKYIEVFCDNSTNEKVHVKNLHKKAK